MFCYSTIPNCCCRQQLLSLTPHLTRSKASSATAATALLARQMSDFCDQARQLVIGSNHSIQLALGPVFGASCVPSAMELNDKFCRIDDRGATNFPISVYQDGTSIMIQYCTQGQLLPTVLRNACLR